MLKSVNILHELAGNKKYQNKIVHDSDKLLLMNFVFTNEQQFKYDRLLEDRKKQVKSYYENNLVYKGGSAK